MLHIHLTIILSFLSSLINSFCLTDQVLNITLHTYAEHSPHFAPKDKLLRASRGYKSLNLHQPFLILFTTLLNVTFSKITKLFHNMMRRAI